MRYGMKLTILLLVLFPGVVLAGKADVLNATVAKQGTATFSFNVTVTHQDDGWEHYADKWEVVGPDGQVLASRILHHPHVNEQPFTRSLSGVAIDPAIRAVTLRAHDLVHGYGGREILVELPR